MAISGNGRLTAAGYAACMTCSATREARRKQMNTTIRGQKLRVRVVMALLAVLVLLAVAVAYAVRPFPTTSHGDATPAHRAMSADSTRGSTIDRDPNVERHAEVVQRLGNGSLR
jgi:hypothetical protein